MTTERRQIEVSGIPVEIVRKDIKNLHLGVYPPHGRVRVAAPTRLDDEAVRLAVVSRLRWIRRQRRNFRQQERQSQREMVSGETHYYQGRRYRLDVVERDAPSTVRLVSTRKLELQVRPGTDRAKREALLYQWYRRQLRDQVPPLLSKWEPEVGVEVAEVRIRRMKTRWGTCIGQAGRIWLNVELAKKPSSCLEYILVHEIVHLVERQHNDRFRELMDSLMPQWRLDRAKLNQAPLSHEEWDY